jgi:hypothetical protein
MPKTATGQGLAGRFTLAPDQRRYRTILRICGERGTGKTRLGLTGPDPVVIFSFDRGTEGVVEEFREAGKLVYDQEYIWDPGALDQEDPQALQAAAIAVRDRFEADYAYALEQGARMLVIDKESDLWQLYRYAEFGGPSEAPKDYQKLNNRYIAMINKAKMYPTANLLLIQAMKDEWGTTKRQNRQGQTVETPKQTGGRIPWGFDRLDELVFGELVCRRDGGEFFFDFKAPWDSSFGKCRQSAALCGDSVPAMTFLELGTLLVPGSTEEDWA